MASRTRAIGLILVAVGIASALAYAGLSNFDKSDAPISGFEVRGDALVPEGKFTRQDVASLEIATDSMNVQLQRDHDGWSVKSRDGYPANEQKILDLLNKLLNASILYDRLVSQSDLPRYGLQPVTAVGSTSARLSLKNARGTVLLELRVGNVMTLPGGAETETLVVLPDERRVAILDQEINASRSMEYWLQPLDIGFDETDVVSIGVGHRDSSSHKVFRRDPDGLWMAQDADGKPVVIDRQEVLNSVASSLATLPITDVASSEMANEEVLEKRSIQLEMIDRRKISYEFLGTGSADWVRFDKLRQDCSSDGDCPSVVDGFDTPGKWRLKTTLAVGSSIDLAYQLAEQ